MKLDTPGLQAFTSIVEHGSFLQASHALNISQAGLSRRLKNLETTLGVRLIDRTTRAWRLSAAGRAFLPRAQRLVAELNAAFHEIRDTHTKAHGEVTVACMASMAFHLLPQIILRYSRAFPRNRIRIVDATAPDVTEAVLQRRADFGINALLRPDAALDATPLLRDPFVFMCRDDHRLSRKRQVRWRDIQDESLILLGRSTGNGLILESAINELKLEIPRLYEVQHPSTALGLVAAGAGAAILPSLIILRDAYPRIRAVPLVAPAISREIGLIRLRGGTLSPAAATLYAMVHEGFVAWSREQRPKASSGGKRLPATVRTTALHT